MEKRIKSKHPRKHHGKPRSLETKTKQQILTLVDRLTYSYIIDKTTNTIIEVVTVSYEVNIEEQWTTIVRYDSAHGYLHQHTRISLDTEKEFISTDNIVKSGDHKEWLTWAMKDIRQNFLEYRSLFFRRSKIVDNYY
jgi:hypothetical protein